MRIGVMVGATPGDPVHRGLVYIRGDPGSASGLMRLPFHELVPSPPVLLGPTATHLSPIRVYHRRLYDEDLLGWQSLPGVPNF